MKRVILMLVATAAFACTTAVAQAGGAAGSAGASGTASQGSQNAEAGNQDMGQTSAHGKHHKGNASGMSGKMSTLTGCMSASPNQDGMYTLSNGKYKNGVEVGPTDKVKDHAGHQVALKGHWGTAAQAGENAGVASSTNEKNEKHFDVDSVKHISETCKEAPGGGTMGHKGHKKDKSNGESTPGSTNTPPPSL